MNVQIVPAPKVFVAEVTVDGDDKVTSFNVFVHVCGFVAEIIALSTRPASL